MNNIDENKKIDLIQNAFHDTRKMKFIGIDEKYQADLFQTENGEIIFLDIALSDFDEGELTKYAGIAEELYEKYEKSISMYIFCPSTITVSVKECEIKSEAEFTIKLACVEQEPCHFVLQVIKEKIRNNETLTPDDIHALSMTHVMCKKEERDYFRKEYFKIMNNL